MPAPKPPPPRVIDAQFSAGAAKAEQLPASPHFEVAFAGRSNVGKSSLMNALLERKRLVRTSSTPGCTRQISLFDVSTRDGARLCFADLPGYGYAKRSHSERRQWGELVDTYLMERPSLCTLVALMDIRRGMQREDEQLLELVSQKPRVTRAPLDIILVATKLDKLSGSQRKLAMVKLEKQTGRRWFGFSTELPDTHARLWTRIQKGLGLLEPAPPAARTPVSSEAPDGQALKSDVPPAP